MRIQIKSRDLKRPIRLIVPNALLSAKWIWRLGDKYISGGNQRGAASGLSPAIMGEVTGALKKYVRQNGHFDMVEITSPDGDEVRIRV